MKAKVTNTKPRAASTRSSWASGMVLSRATTPASAITRTGYIVKVYWAYLYKAKFSMKNQETAIPTNTDIDTVDPSWIERPPEVKQEFNHLRPILAIHLLTDAPPSERKDRLKDFLQWEIYCRYLLLMPVNIVCLFFFSQFPSTNFVWSFDNVFPLTKWQNVCSGSFSQSITKQYHLQQSIKFWQHNIFTYNLKLYLLFENIRFC